MRRVKIVLYDLPEIAALQGHRGSGLNAFDGAITHSRFPLMSEVDLHIMLSLNLALQLRSWQWWHAQAAAVNALPRLQSSGLLKVTVSAKPVV